MTGADKGMVNANELRVIGMSRSGNHAIIQWVAAQARGRICFLNCVQGKYNPYLTPRPMAAGDGERAYVNYPEFDLDAERRGEFSEKDWLIYSHEDDFLGNACSETFELYHDGFVGPSRRRRDVLILRDPFNLFASRRRAGYGVVTEAMALRIWKQHAKEFLGRTRWLRHDPVLISYNRWVADAEYRRTLAADLAVHFTDSGIDTVTGCAGGSSFDGLGYNGRARGMKLFDRWKVYRHDESFRALFDEQVLELSQEIFGWAPALSSAGRRLPRAGQNRGALRGACESEQSPACGSNPRPATPTGRPR